MSTGVLIICIIGSVLIGAIDFYNLKERLEKGDANKCALSGFLIGTDFMLLFIFITLLIQNLKG